MSKSEKVAVIKIQYDGQTGVRMTLASAAFGTQPNVTFAAMLVMVISLF